MYGLRLSSFRAFAMMVVGLTLALGARAQSTSGSLNGTVVDPSGAVVPGATVQIKNVVNGYQRTAKSDAGGQFQFVNLPFAGYVLFASEQGFSAARSEVTVKSGVPQVVTLTLKVATTNTVVEVDAPIDLVENDSTMHTDIDRSTMDRMVVESSTSGLSSIVTLASPGVAADSNGLMHGLGDHAENSFSIDGQQITDQQSKVFSNQVPSAAVQSLEVIDGAPPAEYGDKTSLVVKATTRSGQGVTKPTGSLTLSYGSFGSSHVSADVAYGGKSWGNFIAVDGQQTGRFLDAPEFAVMHDKGNEANVFDRVDYQWSQKDSIHVNGQYTRSWFQTPNDFANIGKYRADGLTTDQKSKIETINFAPTYTRVVNDSTVANVGAYYRRDGYHYYASANPLADYAEAQQQESVKQDRSLTNAGVHADLSYVHGVNNAKLGGNYSHTFLRETDGIAVVDPSITDPTLNQYNFAVNPGAGYYVWHGRADVKQLALYLQDSITAGNWLINAGIRGDFYNGLTIQRQAEPRLGVSYTIKKTGTVLRASYARTQETPFNENLVLSSTGCADPILYAIFSVSGSCSAQGVTPFNPGFRNEFHAGFSQALGKHFVMNAEYIWKYTHNAYDFSVLGTTPITFPIEWHNSKIPGAALSATLRDVKGFTVRFNASSVAARFFNPQIGGVGATPVSTTVGISNGFAPFRIDHDERFNGTTNLQYELPWRKSLYFSMNWKFDSGLVAGATPCYNPNGANSNCDPTTSFTVGGVPYIDLSGLSADQQFQAGLRCNGVAATPTSGFASCAAAQLSSTLLNIPSPNTEDADKNPARVKSRNLFDMAVGDDDIVHFGESNHFKVGARLTAINVANKYALYNFLSTFSGTHYVSPRTVTAELTLHF